jgi:hypothetical protein
MVPDQEWMLWISFRISCSKFQASRSTTSGFVANASRLLTIGMLVPGVSLPFLSRLLSAIQEITVESKPAKFSSVELRAEAPKPMIFLPAAARSVTVLRRASRWVMHWIAKLRLG